MSSNHDATVQTLSPLKLRLLAFFLMLGTLLVGAFSLYWLWEDVIPIYGKLYRNALIIEIPYLGFCLLMAPPIVLISLIACSIVMWTGRKFDPPIKSFLHQLQTLMIYISVRTITRVVPATIILTTLFLLYRDYTPCPKLLISGSAWDLFWVNDDRACFKPTRYINDNWPCTIIGDKEVCIKADGR